MSGRTVASFLRGLVEELLCGGLGGLDGLSNHLRVVLERAFDKLGEGDYLSALYDLQSALSALVSFEERVRVAMWWVAEEMKRSCLGAVA